MTHEVRLRLIYIPPPASNLNVSYIERKRKKEQGKHTHKQRKLSLAYLFGKFPGGGATWEKAPVVLSVPNILIDNSPGNWHLHVLGCVNGPGKVDFGPI